MSNDIPDGAPEFFPDISIGKVIKVLDGDTIHIVSRLSSSANKFSRFTIRLYGFNAWELHTKNGAEKARGIIAQQALEQKILHKRVEIEVMPKKDKYGRIMAKIFLDEEDVIQWMIKNKHGHVYDGGKKKEFDENI